jgi:hypothetical protein
MIDIDAVKARHLNPEKNWGRTYYEGHIEVDLAACVAEIERLQALVDRFVRYTPREISVWVVEESGSEESKVGGTS